MLHRDALPAPLWDLLIRMMKLEPLRDFFLVGGTALALRLGHRESVDLDLFTLESFDAEKLAFMLSRELQAERVYHEPDTVRAVVLGMKVDLLRHAYPLLSPVELIDGIRIASLPDLAAMKLNAVSGRGLRKDFWDIAALLQTYGLNEMLGFYREKYHTGDLWHLIKALDYFEDAEQDTTLIRSIWPYEWDEVKRIIREAMESFITERQA